MAKYEKSAITLAIEQRLAQGSPGVEINVSEMEAICNAPCGNSYTPGWLAVARVIPRIGREHGLIWAWIRDRKVWRCLTNEEKPGVMHMRVRKMRSQSNKALVVGDTVDFQQLNANERTAAMASMVIAGTVRTVTSAQAQKRLAAVPKTVMPNLDSLIDICRKRQGQ